MREKVSPMISEEHLILFGERGFSPNNIFYRIYKKQEKFPETPVIPKNIGSFGCCFSSKPENLFSSFNFSFN